MLTRRGRLVGKIADETNLNFVCHPNSSQAMNSLARITTTKNVIDVNPDAVIDFILQQQQQRPNAEAPAATAVAVRHGNLV